MTLAAAAGSAPARGDGAARSYLLLRRAGSVWGVADAVVEGRTGAGGYRIRAGGEALAADEILAVVERLRVLPLGATLARWWPEAAAGLAVHGGRPLVVIDALHPPRALLEAVQAGEGSDGSETATAKGKPKKAAKGRTEE